mmetsp:Transcript_47312/g.107311  ORF Transcript_47312/g.107311 Transcript_47312/m.107311 type:complete len:282 (-) Transcript_47312:534-1379(-)
MLQSLPEHPLMMDVAQVEGTVHINVPAHGHQRHVHVPADIPEHGHEIAPDVVQNHKVQLGNHDGEGHDDNPGVDLPLGHVGDDEVRCDHGGEQPVDNDVLLRHRSRAHVHQVELDRCGDKSRAHDSHQGPAREVVLARPAAEDNFGEEADKNDVVPEAQVIKDHLQVSSRLRDILGYEPGGGQRRHPQIVQRHVPVPDKILPQDPLGHDDAQGDGDYLPGPQEPVPHAALPEEGAVVLEHQDQLADLDAVPLHRDLVPRSVRSQQRNGHENQGSRLANVFE